MDPKLTSAPGTDVKLFPMDPEEKTTEIVGFLSAIDEDAFPEKYY